MGGGPEGRGSQDVSGKTVTLRTFSLLTAASLSKMQICEMVITVASPSFMGLVFFLFFGSLCIPTPQHGASLISQWTRIRI